MRRLALLTVLFLLLAACNPAPGPESVSTETVPDTLTPTVALPTREPLPPTWTPFMQPTVTPFPSVTPLPYTPPPTLTLPSTCLDFAADYERIGDTFTLGTSPVLYWTAIAVPSYRVVVTDPEGETVLVRWVEGDVGSFTVPAETFDLDAESLRQVGVAVYGWEVTPVDENGVRYCDPVGGELILIPGEAPAAGGGE